MLIFPKDRYKSEVVEDGQYLLAVLRYIHQNPVKAGMVNEISKYKWSSYSEYLGKSKIIDNELILNIFHKDKKRAQSILKDFHKKTSHIKCLDIKETKRLKDHQAIKIIQDLCNISHCANLQKCTIEERNRYIKTLKEKGLSTRQIARLTGISRGAISKV